jgi:uncharacterized RDD family membrane protein YckC
LGGQAEAAIKSGLFLLVLLICACLGILPVLLGKTGRAIWDIVTGSIVMRRKVPDDESAYREMLDSISQFSTVKRRFLCGLIDVVILYGPMFIIVHLIDSGLDLTHVFGWLDLTKESWLGMYAFFCYSWIYLAAMDSGPWQGTIGKLACGIMITDRGGRRISFLRASVRCLLNFAMLGAYPGYGIGFLAAFVTRRRQTLPDLMTQCVVVRRPLPPAFLAAREAKPLRQLRWLWIPLGLAGFLLFVVSIKNSAEVQMDDATKLVNQGNLDSREGRAEKARREYAEALQIYETAANQNSQRFSADISRDRNYSQSYRGNLPFF